MIRRGLTIIVSLGLLVWGLGCGSPTEEEGELIVGAAISLRPVLDEVIQLPDYRTVVMSYAGSGTLRHQIQFGAPLDLFLSAAPEHVDSLESAGLTIAGSRTPLASNALVLVMPVRRAPIGGMPDLALSGILRVAMGDPDIVPAGRYAYESLQHSGVLNEVEHKIIFTKDVQQVLVYVRSGNVDAGFVYATDVLSSSPVRTIAVIPDSLHAPILYEGVVLASSGRVAHARRFLQYLASDSGRALFRRHGFREPPV